MTVSTHRLDLAREAVRRASHMAREIQADLVSDDTVAKKDRSPVTIADFSVQAAIRLELARHFPDEPMLGEEDATHLRTEEGRFQRQKVVEAVQGLFPESGEDDVLDALDRSSLDHGEGDGPSSRFWVLDPIDGTKGFLRRGQYAVALALIEDGKVVLGVLGCPNLPPTPGGPPTGCLVTARKGDGSRLQPLAGGEPEPIAVSVDPDPSHASFLESVEAAHSAHGRHARIAHRLGITAPPVRMDSQCKYAALARGEGAIYLRLPRQPGYQEKIWDHAAGALAVTEAGGRVTDAHGRPLDFSRGRTLCANTGIIASNGPFHDRLLEAVAEVFPEG